MGPRTGMNVLEKRKITSNYKDSNPGPPSPLQPNCHTNSTALGPWTTVCTTVKKTCQPMDY